MPVSLARRNFPRAIERAYAAQIRRRITALELLVRAAVEEDPATAVQRVRVALQANEVTPASVRRTAQAVVGFATNKAVQGFQRGTRGIATRDLSTGAQQILRRRANQRAQRAQGAQEQPEAPRRDALRFTSRETGDELADRINAIGVAPSSIERWAEQNANVIQGLERKTLDDIAREVVGAVVKGETNQTLSRRLQARFGLAKRRAALIARDQVGSLNGQITQDRQRALGVTHYVWATSDDERVRPSHNDLDGNLIAWDTPDPQEGHPGDAINCRCVAIANFGPRTTTPMPGPVPRPQGAPSGRDAILDALKRMPTPSREARTRAGELFADTKGTMAARLRQVRRQMLRQGFTPQDADLAILKAAVLGQAPDLEQAIRPLATIRAKQQRQFKQGQVAQVSGARLVTVDVADLDRLWRESDPSRYVEPGGFTPGGEVAGKYDRFQRWLEDNPDTDIEASYVGFASGAPGFVDGRHRFAVLRDMGVKQITISVDPEDLAAARRLARGPFPAPPEEPPVRSGERPEVPPPQERFGPSKSQGPTPVVPSPAARSERTPTGSPPVPPPSSSPGAAPGAPGSPPVVPPPKRRQARSPGKVVPDVPPPKTRWGAGRRPATEKPPVPPPKKRKE